MIREGRRVFVPHPEIEFCTIADSTVIVDTGEKKLIRLNPTGSAIWRMLDGRTVRDISTEISAVFEVDPADAERDAFEFLEMMLERGFVTTA